MISVFKLSCHTKKLLFTWLNKPFVSDPTLEINMASKPSRDTAVQVLAALPPPPNRIDVVLILSSALGNSATVATASKPAAPRHVILLI